MKYSWYKKGPELLREIRETRLMAGQVGIWYMGQCGVILKLQDKLIGIDLILNDLLTLDGVTRRNYQAPFSPNEMIGLDYLLCTHNHRDHLNLETLVPVSAADGSTLFIVPAADFGFLITGGISSTRVISARHKEPVNICQDLSIIPLAEPHDIYETDENGDDKSLGYIIKCGETVIYHAGDMVVETKIVAELKAFEKIDVAFLPINGRDWEREQRNIIGNMNPRDAVSLANLIDADLTIPTHYDMVQGNCENPLIFAHHMQEYAPGRKYHIMMLGERFLYSK